jgi:hypothetical protein
MRTEYDTDNTFREIEDLLLGLVFGGGAPLDAEFDFLYFSMGITEAFDEVLSTLVGR